jgi:hypothetical protein
MLREITPVHARPVACASLTDGEFAGEGHILAVETPSVSKTGDQRLLARLPPPASTALIAGHKR